MPSLSGKADPVVRAAQATDIVEAMVEGLRDFQRAPRFGLCFGAVYAAEAGALTPVLEGDTRPALVPSGAFYIVRTAALRAHRAFVPPGCLFAEHGGASALDIDTPEDWAIAEAIAAGAASALQQRIASP